MKIFIRDDDTSYFTNPDELQLAYGSVWHKGPISIAVIPFDIYTEGRGNISVFKQDSSREYPIGDNHQLVEFIRSMLKENKLYLMLHGYNHLYDMSDLKNHPFGIPEFVYRKDSLECLKKGKGYLEDLFHQEIKWFVPPSNSMSDEAIENCEKIGLNIATSIGIRKRRKSLSSLYNYFTIKYARLTRKNMALKYGKHYELMTTSFTKASDYDYIARKHPLDNLVIATHYWEVNSHKHIKDTIASYLNRTDRIFPIKDFI